MSEPILPTTLEIARAAIMREVGQSWDATAARLGWPADRIRLWPFQFPEIWNYCFHYALKRHAQIAAAEAVEVLQSQIRQSNCEKTQLAIARTLRQYSASSIRVTNEPHAAAAEHFPARLGWPKTQAA